MRVAGVDSELWDEAPVRQDLPATMPFGLRLGDMVLFAVLFVGFYEVLTVVTPWSYWVTYLAPLGLTLAVYAGVVWLRQGHPDGYHWSLLHWLQLWRIPGAYPAEERRYDAF